MAGNEFVRRVRVLGRSRGVPVNLDMRRMPRFAFPIKLEVQRNGWILASFPDVPEALTEGETEREALDEAQDCLIGALGGYIANGWPIPAPSAIEGDAVAELPEGVTLKLALYDQMIERNMSPALLARRFGKTEDWAGQLLDLDESTPLGQVADAIATLREEAGARSDAEVRRAFG